MGPPIATASIRLSYPLAASDFDPESHGLLLVGGGGGETKSGVGNYLTLIDTTRKQTISEIASVELSKYEDSVTSLAVAQSTEKSGIAFAGINSSTKDQNAGTNEHLRSFEIRYPPRKKKALEAAEKPKEQAQVSLDATRPLGRAALFKPSNAPAKETYQRILRLTRPKTSEKIRLGAIATGLAPEGEIIVFNAASRSPTTNDVVKRIQLGKGEEACDVDIIETQNADHRLGWCTDSEVYITGVASSKAHDSEPSTMIHSTPPASSKGRLGKFRALRFLTSDIILLLTNRPNRSGADLFLLEIPFSPSQGNAIAILRKSLHRSIGMATALSVSSLPSPTSSEYSQSAIAVAGQDNSITIFTLDHPSKSPYSACKLRNYTILRNVHEFQITSLTFSIFHLPSDLSTASPQYLKLASTSVASTVVVHTLPLISHPEASAKQRPSRYVLTSPGLSEAAQMAFSVLISVIVVAIGAFLLQAFTEIRGGTPEFLGAKGWLNDGLHGWIARPYMFEDVMDKLNVPGVETRPMKGVQSQLGDIKNSLKNALQHPEAVEVPGVETRPMEGMKSQAAESVRIAQQQGQHAEKAGERMIEGAKAAAEDAHQSADQVLNSPKQSVQSAQENLGLRDLLSRRSSADGDSASSDIIVKYDQGSQALSADIRDADAGIKKTHKRWQDLEHHQREMWKGKLIDAGEWTVQEGEAVLKGVFFQNMGIAVGEAVRAAM